MIKKPRVGTRIIGTTVNRGQTATVIADSVFEKLWRFKVSKDHVAIRIDKKHKPLSSNRIYQTRLDWFEVIGLLNYNE